MVLLLASSLNAYGLPSSPTVIEAVPVVWQGERQSPTLVQGVSWNIERDGPFTPPCHIQGYRETYYLPYSDELWERLEYMQQKIIELRAQLTALFIHPEGFDQLVVASLLALPAPVGEKR